MSAIFPDFVVVRIATSRVWCTLCSKRNAGQQEPSSFSLCNLGTWSKMGTNSTRLSQATSDSLTDWSWSLGESQPTGHEIRKMGSNSQVRWTLGTGQVPKRIVTWRGHKVRRLGSDKITRKITGSKQLRWMAASEQLRRAPKVSTAARYFSTTITIFPPTSPFKRIIWSFTFRALHRPITIANFCSAENKSYLFPYFVKLPRFLQ